MDPYQGYLLLRVEKMTDAQRRRVDTRAGEIAAAFTLLRRDMAWLFRRTLSSYRSDKWAGNRGDFPAGTVPSAPTYGPPEYSADDHLADGKLTTAAW